jgi:hypothetical protein
MANGRFRAPVPIGNGTASSRSERRFYGDGAPQWIEGRGKSWERRCRTAAEVKQLRERDARLLRRHGKGDPAALALADRLEDCSPRQRCISGACPECCRALQRWFVTTAGKLILGDSDGE